MIIFGTKKQGTAPVELVVYQYLDQVHWCVTPGIRCSFGSKVEWISSHRTYEYLHQNISEVEISFIPCVLHFYHVYSSFRVIIFSQIIGGITKSKNRSYRLKHYGGLTWRCPETVLLLVDNTTNSFNDSFDRYWNQWIEWNLFCLIQYNVGCVYLIPEMIKVGLSCINVSFCFPLLCFADFDHKVMRLKNYPSFCSSSGQAMLHISGLEPEAWSQQRTNNGCTQRPIRLV